MVDMAMNFNWGPTSDMTPRESDVHHVRSPSLVESSALVQSRAMFSPYSIGPTLPGAMLLDVRMPSRAHMKHNAALPGKPL